MEHDHKSIKCPNCQHQFTNPIFAEAESQLADTRIEFEKKLSEMESDTESRELKALQKGIKQGKEAGRKTVSDLLDENSESEQTILALQKKLRQKKSTRKKMKAEIRKELLPILKKESDEHLQKFKEEFKANDDKGKLESNLELNKEREDNKNLRNKIAKLQLESKSMSQEVQGEIGQNYIHDLIKKFFPWDKVTQFKKGQRGADFLQGVAYNQNIIGNILIEVKTTTGSFQKSWVNKLEGDMHDNSVALGVIVSYTLPKEQFDFIHKGIFIVGFNDLRAVLVILRTRILGEYRLNKIGENKNEKAVRVYEFFKSENFARQLKKLFEQHKKIREQLHLEKAYMKKIWANREQQLDDQESVVMGFLGVLESQGEPGDFKLIEEEIGLIEKDVQASIG